MSQIGNRLAGMSANNGTNPNNNSLYSNTNANNNSPQTNKNYSTSANALRQLYNNQPRDNSVTFNTGGSSPYSQPRHAYNSNPNTPMGAPNNGYGGMTGSQTTNFGGVNSNGGYAGHGGGPGGMTKNGISSNSSGNIPAYLQRQQMTNGANNMLNSGGFTGQSQHKMNNNSNNNIPSYLQQQNNSNKSISSNHGNSISSDLYSNGNNIYYAPNSNFTEKVVNFTEKATNELGKTARITKQWLNENYGKGYKTIDQEVHEKINRLKVDKEIYMKLMKLSKQCLEDQRKYMKSQTMFGEFLKEVGQKTPEAADILGISGHTQCRIAQESNSVQLSLQRFTNAIETLVDKTISDSLSSSNRLQTTRLEFDAIRHELDELQRKSIGPVSDIKLLHKFGSIKDQYQKNREELLVKLQLLDENRVRVLKNNLETFDLSQNQFFSHCHQIVDQANQQLNQKRAEAFNGYDGTPGLPGDDPLENDLDEEYTSNSQSMDPSNSNSCQQNPIHLNGHRVTNPPQVTGNNPSPMNNHHNNYVQNHLTSSPKSVASPGNSSAVNSQTHMLDDPTISTGAGNNNPEISVLPGSSGINMNDIGNVLDDIVSDLAPGESAI